MTKTITRELNTHKTLIKNNYEDLRNKILLLEQDAIEEKLNYNKSTDLHNINDSLEKSIEIKKQALANKNLFNDKKSLSKEPGDLLHSPEIISVNKSLENVNEEINKYIDQNSAANKRSFKGYLSKDEENEYDMYNNINDAFLNPHEDTREKILESDEEKISERDKSNEKLKSKSELIKNNKKDNKLGFNLIMPESIDNSAEIFISKEDFNKDSNNLDDKLILKYL
jgi:hypothetical protein